MIEAKIEMELMSLKESQEYNYYKEEIENDATNFFVIDTHGNKSRDGIGFKEQDFVSYAWNLKQYNLVSKGDLFIYRRPQSSSEIKKEFYFFGAGKFGEIIEGDERKVKSYITKPLKFTNHVLKSELNDITWSFKERIREDWQYFFNQYGMNKVKKDDFLMLLQKSLSPGSLNETVYNNFKTENDLENNIIGKNFFVEDKQGNVVVRGSAHNVFARQVKLNYGYTCAITGIRTKEFLVASHIIPWAIDKDNRINPQNGICLSSLMDKAFDKGFITINEEMKIVVSKKVKKDKHLKQKLIMYEGKKINLPSKYRPDVSFLNWHYENIFLK